MAENQKTLATGALTGTPSHAAKSSKHVAACIWLLIATALWGISFPLIKAIWLKQHQIDPAASSIFLAALGVCVRFGVAAVFVAFVCLRTIRQLTRAELWQGAGLAFFGGVGILIQMDGLAYTSASISAFLTQFYCVLIPIWVACRKRTAPSLATIAGTILVLVGVWILAGVNWRQLHIGRGEFETLIAATFFSGQILWLEKAEFANNRTSHFTLIMLAGTALLIFPVLLSTAPSARVCVAVYSNSSVLLMVAILICFCTLGSYTLMNAWQKHVTATEAALIYCFEPVAASLFAVILPQWLSVLAKIDYANEQITTNLGLGGSLILLANIFIQIEAAGRRSLGANSK